MKTLGDGTQVSSRSFYYLLEFNDRNNKKIMIDLWGIENLKDLTIMQFTYLFDKAIQMEIKDLNSKIPSVILEK